MNVTKCEKKSSLFLRLMPFSLHTNANARERAMRAPDILSLPQLTEELKKVGVFYCPQAIIKVTDDLEKIIEKIRARCKQRRNLRTTEPARQQ